jgi:hypothetical protein
VAQVYPEHWVLFIEVEVEVTLRLTASQSVSRGVGHPVWVIVRERERRTLGGGRERHYRLAGGVTET